MSTTVYAVCFDELWKGLEKKGTPSMKATLVPEKAPAEEEALPNRYGFVSDCPWHKAADYIDRFRDKVSSYYGFERELIRPVYITCLDDPLKDSKFDVRGIRYEVKDARLTCIGELR